MAHYSLVIVLCSLPVLASCERQFEVECPPWFFYDSATNQCKCYNKAHMDKDIHCTETGVLVGFGHCMTYDKNVGTFFAKCFYFSFLMAMLPLMGTFHFQAMSQN